MSTEFHNRMFDGRQHSWDVSKLRNAARDLEVIDFPLNTLSEFETVYWFDDAHPATCRAVVEHARRISAADLSDPILLSPDGWVIDGMHRIARAFLENRRTIKARKLLDYPPPDRIACP